MTMSGMWSKVDVNSCIYMHPHTYTNMDIHRNVMWTKFRGMALSYAHSAGVNVQHSKLRKKKIKNVNG